MLSGLSVSAAIGSDVRTDPKKAAETDGTFIQVKDEGGEGRLVLRGEWTIDHADALVSAISATGRRVGDRGVSVDATGIAKIDTAGAWLLKKHLTQGDLPARMTEQQSKLLSFVPYEKEQPKEKPKRQSLRGAITDFGRAIEGACLFAYGFISFIGEIFVRFIKNFASPRHFRFPSIIRHMYEAGLTALPIVGLLGILMSMVIAYQASIQLKKFGADIFTVDLSVISILREMGVLITAIMVAGRSGSAFAAEIGVMKLREEVDALRTMGMDPIEVLVLPRVLGLVLSLPLLTFFADLVGLAGGGVMAQTLSHISLHQYIDRAQHVATFNMFFAGMIKAPVFAFLIAVVGTYQGMNVTGSAESVGRLTTVAVIQSIFLVIMTDAFFSIIFANAGI